MLEVWIYRTDDCSSQDMPPTYLRYKITLKLKKRKRREKLSFKLAVIKITAHSFILLLQH